MIKNFINKKFEKLQKEKNAIIFIILDDSKMLQTLSIKNFMRFFEFIQYKKNNKLFLLINDYDNND